MTTRRQVLAAAIAAPIATVPAGAATLVCAPTSTSPEWNAAIARLRAAEAAVDAYYQDVFDPADAIYRQREVEVQALIDAVPHYTTKATFETIGKGFMSLTSARSDHVSLAKQFVANPELFQGEGDAIKDWHRALRELNEAVDPRDAEIAKIKADNPVEGVPRSIRDGLDRVESESYAAFCVVVEFPVTTLAELRAKISYAKGQELDIEHDALLADLARIFGEG